MFCKKCGKEIADDATFCSSCGTVVNEEFAEKALTNIYIIPMGTEIECLKIAQTLRNAGYKTEVEMKNRKMRKALDYANVEHIPYVFILGEDELKNK